MTENQDVKSNKNIVGIVIVCPSCEFAKGFDVDLTEAWSIFFDHGKHVCEACGKKYSVKDNIDYDSRGKQ